MPGPKQEFSREREATTANSDLFLKVRYRFGIIDYRIYLTLLTLKFPKIRSPKRAGALRR
jgi:hypothetical protein